MVKVRWCEQRGYWQLQDHPGPGQKKRTKKLGPTDADKARGEEYAAAKNAERADQATRRRERMSAKCPIRGDVALRQWWEIAQDGYGDANRDNVQGWLEHHLLPFFGSRDLRELTDLDIKAFGGRIAQTPNRNEPHKMCGRATIKNCLTVLSSCLHWLEQQHRLDFRITVRGIAQLGVKAGEAKGAPVSKRDAWSREEVDAIFGLLRPGPLHDIVFAALHTGARYGELLALEWQDVDVLGGKIEIRQTLTKKNRLKPPKNGKPRTFKMKGTQIQAHFARMAAERFKRDAFRRTSSERVFLNATGGPRRYGGLNSAWQRLMLRASKLGIRELEFHCWRHTYVSWALGAGVNPSFVASQIGDTLKVMHETYEHFMPDEHEAQDDFLTSRGSGPARPLQGSAPVAEA